MVQFPVKAKFVKINFFSHYLSLDQNYLNSMFLHISFYRNKTQIKHFYYDKVVLQCIMIAKVFRKQNKTFRLDKLFIACPYSIMS